MRRRGPVLQSLVLLSAVAIQATVLCAQGGQPASTGDPARPPQTGAQTPATGRAGGAAIPNLTAAEAMGPVENLAAYPVPPEGFNVARNDIPHGEVKLVEYDSKTLGIRRPLRVYTPPGYSTGRRYPVLYLLHGLGIRAPSGCNGRERRSSPTT